MTDACLLSTPPLIIASCHDLLSSARTDHAPFSEYAVDLVFIIGLTAVGFWLESINGKHGWLDELLTPFPLGLAGLAWAIGEAWS